MIDRNIRAGRGEIDLLVREGEMLVAVEVKTRVGSEPMDAIDDRKLRAIRSAAAKLDTGPSRFDVVTIRADDRGVTVRWVKGVG